MARKNVDLYNIDNLPENLRQALLELRLDYDAHNHDGANSSSIQTLSVETLSARVIQIRKTSFSSSIAGIWIGLTGNVVKFNLGDASRSLKWDGTNLTIKGDLTAGSININDKAVIDSSGNGTFIGLTSINMKAYTCFETEGRFIENQAGSGDATFGNQGATVAPGTTSTSYIRLTWYISRYIFNNNPTFTCSLLCLGGFETGNGVGFVGLGLPTITGSGFTETGKNFCGFEFKKTSGTTTIIAIQCDGGGTATFSSSLATLSNNDVIELYLKINDTDIDYYTRVNGGSLSSVTTLSDTLPSGSESYIHFSSSNKGGTDDFKIQLQTAAYEH